MSEFNKQLLRLKEATGIMEDQGIAALLGLTKSAFSERKKRDSFPVKEAFALASQRPELGLDPDWIVTGASNKMETAGSREASLLQCFKKLNDKEQLQLLQIALLWSGEMVLALPSRNEQI